MSSGHIACQECSSAISDPREGKDFCCASCRQAFNNRRMKRGAEMYDLFRALRRERSTAKSLNIWTEMCRLELKWQEEDEAQRPGRRSYAAPKRALAQLYDRGALQRGEVLVRSHFNGRSGAQPAP